jgi:hypothetical protein
VDADARDNEVGVTRGFRIKRAGFGDRHTEFVLMQPG